MPGMANPGGRLVRRDTPSRLRPRGAPDPLCGRSPSMPRALRLLAATLVSILLLLGAGRVLAVWFGHLGFDLGAWPKAAQTLERETLRGETLDRLARETQNNLRAKFAVAADLAESRLSLVEAVAVFRELSDT